jgi:Swi5-dependent recombination DNA repair protein 1
MVGGLAPSLVGANCPTVSKLFPANNINSQLSENQFSPDSATKNFVTSQIVPSLIPGARTMVAPPAAKRRRLNDALHKPFKSPLRAPPQPHANLSVASPLSREPLKASDETTTVQNNASFTVTPIRPKLDSNPLQAVTQSIPTDQFTVQTTQTSQKNMRRLESLSIKYRQENDTLNQALAILKSTKSAELEALTEKWRSAARLAAEEVFAGARDKVNRMGGVGAWRERETEQKGFADAWEQEPVKNAGDDGSDEDEGEGEEREGQVYGVDKRVPTVDDDWEYDKGRMKEEQKEIEGNDDDVGVFPSTSAVVDNALANLCTEFHYGYDAQDAEHRTGAHRL